MEPRPITGKYGNFDNREYLKRIANDEDKKIKLEKFMKKIFNDNRIRIDYKLFEVLKSDGKIVGFNDYEIYDETFENNKNYFEIMSTIDENYVFYAANYFVNSVEFAKYWIKSDNEQKKIYPYLWNETAHKDWVKALHTYVKMAKYTEDKYKFIEMECM
ncbi:MAG: hypothetical protein KBT30_02280 [Clostridiales bacterium]|nr:hypothetical protein [Candidatus Apopatousia equi]